MNLLAGTDIRRSYEQTYTWFPTWIN